MLDLCAVQEKIEEAIEFDAVEWEGNNVVRFDRGDNSFWIYENGSIDNLETWPKAMQTRINKLVTSLTLA
jgi:hypothetical protein